MTVLDEILQEKEREVAILQRTYEPKSELKQKQRTQSLFETFMASDYMNIIAEIKRASPSKGSINPDVNPPLQGEKYQEYGAGAISVLTDYPFFKGTIDDLAAVREAVALPILNKDFIIDEIQIDRARDYGANVILLIAAALPKHRLQELFTYASKQDLEVLFEVHNEAELKVAQEIGAAIIGINNRDLKIFQVDLAITEKLASLIDTEKTLVISESGIKTTADVERIKQVGVRGILVGETMMRSRQLEKTFSDLRIQL